MRRTTLPQRAPATDTISYAGYRFPPDVVRHLHHVVVRFGAGNGVVVKRIGN
jgi:putative transposase